MSSFSKTQATTALSSAEAELYGIVDGAARGMQSAHLHEELNTGWFVNIESDSSAAIAISSRSGVGRTRHIATRWLWVQDAVRNKSISLHKVKGTENVADLGTKAVEVKKMEELRAKLPLGMPRCPKFLAVLSAMGFSTAKGMPNGLVAVSVPTEEVEVYTYETTVTVNGRSVMPVYIVVGAATMIIGVLLLAVKYCILVISRRERMKHRRDKLELEKMVEYERAKYKQLREEYDKFRGIYHENNQGQEMGINQARRSYQRLVEHQRSADSLVSDKTKQFRNVASQSQTTYTSVRRASRPRFLPLPEHSHG